MLLPSIADIPAKRPFAEDRICLSVHKLDLSQLQSREEDIVLSTTGAAKTWRVATDRSTKAAFMLAGYENTETTRFGTA